VIQKKFNRHSLSNALSALAALGFEGLSADDLHKLNTTDQFEEELAVMTEVSAYCCVAQKVGYPNKNYLFTSSNSHLSS
jgi:hypothetical protein